MDYIKNLVEYYDELFPVSEEQVVFYQSLLKEYSKPLKFLGIGCGTGILENRLAKELSDVTGIETIKELLESATRKYRTQLMSVRYFKMSTIEMVRFLGKGFYNVISCLNDRIIFIHDKVLIKKFFFDCKQLLSDSGLLILQLLNYDYFIKANEFNLPKLSSIRVELISKLEKDDDMNYFLSRSVQTGNGKILPVYKRTPVYPISKLEIEEFAREAGFTSINFYSDYSLNPVNENSKSLVVMLK